MRVYKKSNIFGGRWLWGAGQGRLSEEATLGLRYKNKLDLILTMAAMGKSAAGTGSSSAKLSQESGMYLCIGNNSVWLEHRMGGRAVSGRPETP